MLTPIDPRVFEGYFLGKWTPLMSGVPQRRMRRCEPGDHDRLARADHDPPCGAAHARLQPKQTAYSRSLNKPRLQFGAPTCRGVFNYLSGAAPRAPVWLRRVHLEWLHR